MTLAERFWSKVSKREGNDACWVWIGSGDRYGTIRIAGKTRKAHIVSWFLHHGVWPKDNVLHKCDYGFCVRPDHLFEGTQAQNVRDMHAKDRDGGHGERAYNCVLSTEDVLEIKQLSTTQSRADIARKFGVSAAHVSNIVNNVKRKRG